MGTYIFNKDVTLEGRDGHNPTASLKSLMYSRKPNPVYKSQLLR